MAVDEGTVLCEGTCGRRLRRPGLRKGEGPGVVATYADGKCRRCYGGDVEASRAPYWIPEGRDSKRYSPARQDNWQREAACVEVDPELFFVTAPDLVHEAREVCRACPVRRVCLTWAVENGQAAGVWGGLTEIERRKLRRRRRGGA